jgi:hypothetical protein
LKGEKEKDVVAAAIHHHTKVVVDAVVGVVEDLKVSNIVVSFFVWLEKNHRFSAMCVCV